MKYNVIILMAGGLLLFLPAGLPGADIAESAGSKTTKRKASTRETGALESPLTSKPLLSRDDLTQPQTPTTKYFANLYKKVGRAWSGKPLAEKLNQLTRSTIRITYRLHSDGTVDGFSTQVERSESEEGTRLLTEHSIQAIKKAAPFGPWPVSMRKRYGASFLHTLSFSIY